MDFESLVFIGSNNRPELYKEVFRQEIGPDIPIYALDKERLEEAVVRGSLRIFRNAKSTATQ